ncbi:MAG: MG2 domain-containing protein [Planctomycetales bacterium]
MITKPVFRHGITSLFLIGAAALWQSGILAQRVNKSPAKKTVTELLGGESRFLTHVSTDKPIYRPGEKVYLRGVLLHARTRQPLPDNQQAVGNIQITGPKGDVVAAGYVRSENSVVGFPWSIPEGQPGGEYVARVTYPNLGHPPAERKFDVRAYRAPRLKSQIVFVRKGYGPGDEVAAGLKVERAAGGFPAGAKVSIQARVDGIQVFTGATQVSETGVCSARFKLPKNIARGEGTLAFIIEDGGIIETASKTIPILLQTLDVSFYPEGGDLIAGLPNRVYGSARTPSQRPADVAGLIVDSKNQQVAAFRTEHEGRGRVSFTPTAGEQYRLRVTEPSGINTTFPLPEAKADGVVLRTQEDVAPADGPVRLQIVHAADAELKVTLRQRERTAASKTISVKAGKPARVALTPADSSDGVFIATVWDAQGAPLAERLVFRRPKQSIHVSITPDRDAYTPGGLAAIKIKTVNPLAPPSVSP